MNLQKYTVITGAFVLAVGAIGMADSAANGDSVTDPNRWLLVPAGPQLRARDFMLEAASWPSVDFNNVRANIVEPDRKKHARFNKLLWASIREEVLPNDVGEATKCLKDWRRAGQENFVVQYYRAPYAIRIRNQVIKRRTKDMVWPSYWVLMAIQRKDKKACVDKGDVEAIFKFVDTFLADKIGSKAQDYERISNMDQYWHESMDSGEFIAYVVEPDWPNIGFVGIWTDGKTVLLSLQEIRGLRFPKAEKSSK
jgi:hypothetical protein